MIRRPPRSTQGVSSAASDVYKRQVFAICHRLASVPCMAYVESTRETNPTHPSVGHRYRETGSLHQTLWQVTGKQPAERKVNYPCVMPVGRSRSRENASIPNRENSVLELSRSRCSFSQQPKFGYSARRCASLSLLRMCCATEEALVGARAKVLHCAESLPWVSSKMIDRISRKRPSA